LTPSCTVRAKARRQHPKAAEHRHHRLSSVTSVCRANTADLSATLPSPADVCSTVVITVLDNGSATAAAAADVWRQRLDGNQFLSSVTRVDQPVARSAAARLSPPTALAGRPTNQPTPGARRRALIDLFPRPENSRWTRARTGRPAGGNPYNAVISNITTAPPPAVHACSPFRRHQHRINPYRPVHSISGHYVTTNWGYEYSSKCYRAGWL